MRNNIYDRNEYFKNRHSKEFLDAVEADKIRFEIQLLNFHLNYNKFIKKIPNDLEIYFKLNLRNKYIENILKSIIFNGDYCTENATERIMKKDTLLKEKYGWGKRRIW